MRVGAHPQLALGRLRGDLGSHRSGVIEQLLGPVGPKPFLELGEVLRVRPYGGERHLMGAERPLGGQAVDLLRARPPLRCAQHDHRPPRPGCLTVLAGAPLDLGDLVENLVERRRHQLVHLLGVRSLHESRRVAVTLEQGPQLLGFDPGEHRRIGDLVPVQVQHRQHGAVT